MELPPSRFSRGSRRSILSSTLFSSSSPSPSSSFSSPRPPSSALSVRSEDSSVPERGLEVQSYLDNLLPGVTALLSRFDRVNQITEDIHNLEIKLEEAQARRRKTWLNNKEKSKEEVGKLKEADEGKVTGDVKQRRAGFLYPRPRVSLPSSFSFTPSTLQFSAASMCISSRTRSSSSESESVPLHLQPSRDTASSETAMSASGPRSFHAGSPGSIWFPRRRAWHSGSSHSADAVQRAFQVSGLAAWQNGEENFSFKNTRPRSEEGARRQISDGVPVKRKAWISEGPETE